MILKLNLYMLSETENMYQMYHANIEGSEDTKRILCSEGHANERKVILNLI